MPQPRQQPMLRDLANFAATFAEHPDIQELHRRGRALTGQHTDSTDLAELAADYEPGPEHLAELVRSAQEILKGPQHPMPRTRRRIIGGYLTTLGLALLAVLPWAWSLAYHASDKPAPRAHFLGLGFTPSPEFSLIAIVILAALLGSVAVLLLTFSSRAGHETLERGYLWWYLTRPITAAGIGVLFYMAVLAGYFNQAVTSGHATLIAAAAIGGLAGLFTDQILSKMRSVLGLTAFDKAAAGTADKT
jgi:hypothetical protein